MNIQNFADRLNNVSSAEEAGLMIVEFVNETKNQREAAKAVALLADAGVAADDLNGFIMLTQEVTGWTVSVEMGRFHNDVDGFEAKADKMMADFDKEVNAGMAAFKARSNAKMADFEERTQFKKDNFFQDADKYLG